MNPRRDEMHHPKPHSRGRSPSALMFGNRSLGFPLFFFSPRSAAGALALAAGFRETASWQIDARFSRGQAGIRCILLLSALAYAHCPGNGRPNAGGERGGRDGGREIGGVDECGLGLNEEGVIIQEQR